VPITSRRRGGTDLQGPKADQSRPRRYEGLVDMTLASKAEALFVSSLQPSDHPSVAQIAAAIRASLRQRGGVCGCAGACADAFGEHPDTARDRMR
jgi:hypothetical protein